MKVLSLLSLVGVLLVLIGLSTAPSSTYTPVAKSTPMPDASEIIPAMPRSPNILQRVNAEPVQFDAFEAIKVEDDDGIEYGILILHRCGSVGTRRSVRSR